MINIYDSTLRDGSQMYGISFSVEDRIRIATKLDEFGISYIEGGNPGSNPKEREFFKKMEKIALKNSKLVSFGSTRRVEIKAEADENLHHLLSANTEYVAIYGKAWDFHVTDILGTSLNENLNMIKDSIEFLVKNNRKVFFDAEHFFDGYKNNPEYALEVLETAQNAGAIGLVLCDTNGGCLTDEIFDICSLVKAKFPNIELGIHCHNDMDLAVANSIKAVQTGFNQIQGTINGYGERCGNANLCSIIPALELKMNLQCLSNRNNIASLTEVSKYVAEIANIVHDSKLPYVGELSFTHKAGAHINAVNKNPKSFEHLNPESVGNQRNKLVSELAGKSSLLEYFEKYEKNIDKNDERVKHVLKRIKELEQAGYQFENANASLELIIAKEFNKYIPSFELLDKVIMDKKDSPNSTIAVVKIKVNEIEELSVAEGDGPVNALDKAIRNALEKHYPILKNMKLEDFKVRVIESGKGTDVKVIVHIESSNSKAKWTTVGVSTNIIQASYEALVSSIEYMLMKNK